jgi:hypothetical protein
MWLLLQNHAVSFDQDETENDCLLTLLETRRYIQQIARQTPAPFPRLVDD